MENNSLKIFEDKNIRVQWDEEEEKWYFSVVDVVSVLTDSDYQKSRNYWKWLKNKLNEEGSEPGKVYVIQTSNNESIGIVGLDYILGPTAYLTFALKTEYWHKGIMQTVLNDFLSKYTKLYKNIIVRVKEDNAPALKLLSKLSYSLQIELLKSSNY